MDLFRERAADFRGLDFPVIEIYRAAEVRERERSLLSVLVRLFSETTAITVFLRQVDFFRGE